MTEIRTDKRTNELRFVMRDGKRILQQLWAQAVYPNTDALKAEAPSSGGTCWRDIPFADGPG